MIRFVGAGLRACPLRNQICKMWIYPHKMQIWVQQKGQPRGVAPTVAPFYGNSVTNVGRGLVFFYIITDMTHIGKTTFNARACGAGSRNVFSTSHSQLTTSQSSRINPLSFTPPPPPPPPPPRILLKVLTHFAYKRLNPDSPDFLDFPEKAKTPIYKCFTKSAGMLIPDFSIQTLTRRTHYENQIL